MPALGNDLTTVQQSTGTVTLDSVELVLYSPATWHTAQYTPAMFDSTHLVWVDYDGSRQTLQIRGGDVNASQGSYLGYGQWFGNDETSGGAVSPATPITDTPVDIAVFQARPGDCNGDRSVSFADFQQLANHYTGPLEPGTGGREWRQGDFDGDGDVDFADFDALANNYTGAGVEYGLGSAVELGFTGGTGGRTTQTIFNFSATALPEPSTVVMLFGGALCLWAWRYRRRRRP
ncbi:MAG: hypothetical protein A2V70_16000 [Planctomycetes bacterium RBG_13_63_9]|nr:MAG: hypothetical protein A2V70_16000 [Planctomycetes bacterium RBG_13_63_9]